MTKVTKIIFDNDGVNIDSEHVAMQVMDDFGYDMVAKYIAEPIEGLKRGDIFKTYAGTSSNKIIQELIEKYSLPIDNIKTDYGLSNIDDGEVYEALSDIVTRQTMDRFEEELKAIPGITQALEETHQIFGIENCALCTTSRADRMKISLDHATDPNTGENARLAELFPDDDNRRISGYGPGNKYTLFMELNPDWNPAETIIVEDSLSGVRKALATSKKFRVVGTVASQFYGDSYEAKIPQIEKLLEAGASVVVTDVADFPAVFQWLNDGMDMKNIPDFKGPVHHNQGTSSNAPTAKLPENHI